MRARAILAILISVVLGGAVVAPVAAQPPKAGGTLKISLPGAPPSLSPHATRPSTT